MVVPGSPACACECRCPARVRVGRRWGVPLQGVEWRPWAVGGEVTGGRVVSVGAIKRAVEATPRELVRDRMERGIVLCGGGALLSGLDQLVAHETLIPASVAEEPLRCVVRGTGIVLEEIDILRRVLVRSRRARALRY